MIPIIIKTAGAFLIASGIMLILNVSLHNFNFNKINAEINGNFKKTGLHKIKFLSKIRMELRKSGIIEGKKLPLLIISSMISGITGYILGIIIFDAAVMEVFLSIGFAFIPLIVLKVKNGKRRLRDMERLCSSMMLISNAYMVSDDLLSCISENLGNLEYPEPFEEFITYVTLMDSSIVSGLIRMESMVPVSYFIQWTDALILAQNDRRIKGVILSIVDNFHDEISSVKRSDGKMHAVWQEYFITVALIMCIPAVFRLFMNDAYIVMTESAAGKVLLLMLALSLVYSVIKAVRINSPEIL